MVKENLIEVESRVRAACERAGRSRDDVTLLCVTKTKPLEMLQEAYDAGYKSFGENKVQEIVAKYPALPSDIEWHMIGHLQTNKVKQVVDKVCMIHSVDSLHLASEISKQSAKIGRVMPILIEVNVAEEDSKFGVHVGETEELIRQIAVLPGVKVKGLMTIAPFTDDAETNRKYFRNLRELSIDISRKSIDNVDMCALSMGMSGDYEVAIEEGATIVRVGTGIFGERHYT